MIGEKPYILIAMLWLFICTLSIANGQTNNTAEVSIDLSIPAVALIDLVVDENQILTFSYSSSDPNQVEQVVTPSTGDNTWINYSSIVSDGLSNYITAHLSQGTLPANVLLNLIIGEDMGVGAGMVGTVSGQITLSSYPQNIINDIGSCYTGTGLHKGHQLIYIWEYPQSYSYSLSFENGEAISVTYTITSTE
ncbi:MAG: hypothetical protein QM487_04445 [Candidatus Marithrix sp.]